MLRIRREQMEILSSALREAADRRLATYARERFPDRFAEMDAEALIAMVGRVRATAKRYGIDRESDVATFLDLDVMYGEHFHRAPWASDALQSEAMSGSDKMAVLRGRVKRTGVLL
jgi:hypothetical protein